MYNAVRSGPRWYNGLTNALFRREERPADMRASFFYPSCIKHPMTASGCMECMVPKSKQQLRLPELLFSLEEASNIQL